MTLVSSSTVAHIEPDIKPLSTILQTFHCNHTPTINYKWTSETQITNNILLITFLFENNRYNPTFGKNTFITCEAM